jgi:hypothetical protein
LPPSDSQHAPFDLDKEGRHLVVPHSILYAQYPPAQEQVKLLKHSEDWQTLDEATCIVLLQSPEHLTAINARRRLVLARASTPEAELRFVRLLFTMRPHCKSLPLWHYRRWLLKRLDAPDLSAELLLARQCCAAYPRNYGAYCHRVILARQASDISAELAAVQSHLDVNPSDHTAASLHVYLLSLRPEATQAESALVFARLERYPQFETSWLHLRDLCDGLPRLLPDLQALISRLDVDGAAQPEDDTLAGREAQDRLRARQHARRTADWMLIQKWSA